MALVDRSSPTHGGPDRRPHILLSAHTCEPDKGSEQAEGWNWVKYLSRWFRLSVITWTEHRAAIETWCLTNELPHVRFNFVDVPFWPRILIEQEATFYFYYTLWQLRAWRLARRILAEDPFELVHHVTLGSLPGPVFMQFLPVPFVLGPAGGGEHAPSSFWTGGGFSAWAYEWLRDRRLRSLRRDPIFGSVVRRAAQIVVTTPQSAQLVPEQFRDKVVQMSTCGLETSHVQGTVARPPRGRRIFTGGRLLHWKGFHLAIEAFARIADEFPDATLQILGDGPQRGRLERLAAERGVAQRVTFSGLVARSEVLRVRDESDIFLFCSLHDAGGLSVVEAMAGGRPIVCLDTGGPGLSVTPECGVKVPVTSPAEVVDGLASSLRQLLANPDQRARMGEAARARVLAQSVWERRADRMLGIYRAALKERWLPPPTAFRESIRANGPDASASLRSGRAGR